VDPAVELVAGEAGRQALEGDVAGREAGELLVLGRRQRQLDAEVAAEGGQALLGQDSQSCPRLPP
jgi:hypothetical protein